MAHGVNKSDNIVDHLNLRKNYLANRFPVTETNYKEIIDKYFFVGILEYIKPSIEILSTILRKNNTNIPWLNKTNIKNTNYLLSDKLIEEFKSNNVLDYKVYHYCLEKFKASLSENKKIILQKNKQTHNLSNRAKDFITTQNKSQIAPEILIASENPRISIITPSFNQAEFLEESINSVLNQGYPNLEYIIMDGGSTDGSVDIIKKYKKYLKHWQSKKDNGQYWAINQGFKNTSGEIMSWLNSDDKYYPKSFFLVAEIFKSDKKYQWITGIPNHIDRNSNMSWIIKKIPKYSRFKYLCGEYDSPFIQQEGTFWKRSLWEKAGNYLETNYRLASDLELWVRFFRHDVIYVVSQITGSYRKHGNQKAQLYMDQYIKEAEKIIKEEVIKYNTGLYSYMPLPPDPIVV
jgi:hypothetical protein